MGRLASEPEDHAATGQQRRPWCTNVLAAAAVIADVSGDCADTIHVALSASTSDKARYVNLGPIDIAGLAVLETSYPADVLPETAPAVRASRITACLLAMPPYRVNLLWGYLGSA